MATEAPETLETETSDQLTCRNPMEPSCKSTDIAFTASRLLHPRVYVEFRCEDCFWNFKVVYHAK